MHMIARGQQSRGRSGVRDRSRLGFHPVSVFVIWPPGRPNDGTRWDGNGSRSLLSVHEVEWPNHSFTPTPISSEFLFKFRTRLFLQKLKPECDILSPLPRFSSRRQHIPCKGALFMYIYHTSGEMSVGGFGSKLPQC